MVLKPSVYAKLLGDKIQKYNVNCWLVNTGWTGGPYGTGSRMKIEYTRRMLNAALSGELESVVTYKDNYFGLEVPTKINGIPDEILHPQNTWPDKSKYDETARKLAAMFKENFKNFEANVSEDVKKAGPIV